jgi:putative transposase
VALDRSALLEVMEALKAAESVIGASPQERAETRTALRNGHRPRTLSTTAGDLEVRIP